MEVPPPSRPSAAPLVLGLGSPWGDDQVAWRVVVSLQQQAICEAACLASPWNLLDWLPRSGPLILLDAAPFADLQALTRWLSIDQLTDELPVRHSSHGGSLREVLKLSQSLRGALPPLWIVAIAGDLPRQGVCQPDTQLSDLAARAAAQAGREVQEFLR